MGRRLYETMLYWETADQDPSLDDDRLALGCDLEAPSEGRVLHHAVGCGGQCPARHGRSGRGERLRTEPGDGDIAIGGATLAGEAARLGLIDEYQPRVIPVLVGGGIPFYPHSERRVDLELVESRAFGSRTVWLRYRVAG